MNGQISLNALHHWVSQYLQRSSVCVLGCCFNILAGSLHGCFSLCFLFLQSLKNIQRIGLSQIFCGHAHSPMHVNDLLDSQEYIGTFQRPYGYLISQHFFFFGQCLVCPNVITASGSCYVKHLLLTVFDKCPGEKSVHIDCVLIHVKYRQAPRVVVSRELSNRSSSDSSLWVGLLGSSKPIMSPSIGF